LQLQEDELIDRCKIAIREKLVPENRIDQLLRDLDSQIHQDNFMAVKAGGKVSISFADFYRKYRRFFDHARSTDLQITSDYAPLPERIEQQVLIRQLLDVDDLSISDLEQITTLTIRKRIAENNLFRWQCEGELTGIELEEFDEESITWWENAFRESHGDTNKTHFARAREVVNALRKVTLKIGGQSLGIQFSNGQFYKLADKPKIGFAADWKTRYPDVRHV